MLRLRSLDFVDNIPCLFAVIVTVSLAAMGAAQQVIKPNPSPEFVANLTRAGEYYAQAKQLFKMGMFELAESPCEAAIQLYEGAGLKGNGALALRGMILYNRGFKRSGFEVLRDSYPGVHGGAETELYLGRIAVELGEIPIALKSLKYFQDRQIRANALAESTREYWPKGGTTNSLHAALLFLDGARLHNLRTEETPKALRFLERANELEPNNIAINYGLARMYERVKDYRTCLTHYRFVASRAKGQLQDSALERVKFWEGAELDKPKGPAPAGTATGAGGIG